MSLISKALLAWLVLGSGLALGPVQRLAEGPPAASGQLARQHVDALAGRIGSRPAGSAAEREAAAYIEGAFRDAGYQPSTQSFPLSSGAGRSANIVAVRDGLSTREIIVGAHYDSQRRGPGADDNASGVGVLLEVASALGDTPVPYTLRFVAFGSEERGLEGARYFVATMGADAIENTVAMINLDSLTAGDLPYVYGTPGDGGRIRDWVLAEAARRGLELRTQEGLNPDYSRGTTCACSDHAPFEEAGIQYAYFESTNWALGDQDGYTQVDPSFGENGYIWHTPYDTLEYLDTEFPGRVDARLELFSRLLYTVLTGYRE